MTEGKTLGEKVAALDQWTLDHERRCDDRQGKMAAEIKDMKKATWAVVWTVMCFLALQVYNEVRRPTIQPQTVNVSATQSR